MKNLNKVLAMLVVFAMMLTTVAFASSFSDVADSSSYNKAITVDADLGLITGYEDGTFKPEGEITRAEFAAIVVRMKGQEAQAKSAAASTSFTDVPATHWAAGYINIATQAGIINGYGNGKFGPDDLVNYEDALTMVVRALGYEHAIGSAGYPTGYITKAGELGLTTGVNGNVGVAANRGTVAAIAFNALDVPLMLQKGYGTFTQWIPYDGTDDTSKKTLLSEYHDAAKIQGTVDSIKYKTTNASSKDDTVSVTVTNGLKNRFEIGLDADGKLTNRAVTMNIGSSDAANFVGKKVVMFVYYDEFEDECTVASLYEASSVDNIVLSIADIDSVTAKTGYAEVKYYNENNKLTTITVKDAEDLTKVYYNGIKGKGTAWNDILDLSGTVEFSLIGDGSYDYDTTYVTAYSTFVVKSVRAASSSVSSKFANGTRTIYFDPDDTSYKATLTSANGTAMDFKDLKENDVLMLKYVNDGSVDIYDAYVVNNTVTGTVTSLSGSAAAGSTDRTVTIDSKEYDVAKNVESKIGKTIKLGDEGTYYLNDNDEIVYFDATLVRSDNYGYVIADYVDTGLSNKYQVQIVGKDNSVTIYDLANKVKVGYYDAGHSTTSKYDTVQKDSDVAYNLIKGKTGIVTYKLNSANEISTICLSTTQVSGDDKYDVLSEFVTNQKATYDSDREAFKVGSKYYYITDSTVIFNTGYDKAGAINDDTEVIANNSFEDGQEYIGAYIYDVDENDDTIGAMAFVDPTGKNTFGAANDYAFFITSAGETDDEDGDTVTYVKGYRGLAEETLTSSDVSLAKAQSLVGALVYPTYNANGTIKDLLTSYANSDNSKVLVSGALTDVDADRDYITVAGTEYKVKSDTNIYVYDKVKSSSRKPYEVGSDIYFTKAKKSTDADYAWGIYHDKDMINATVTAYLYLVDDDVVDLVYYITAYTAK